MSDKVVNLIEMFVMDVVQIYGLSSFHAKIAMIAIKKADQEGVVTFDSAAVSAVADEQSVSIRYVRDAIAKLTISGLLKKLDTATYQLSGVFPPVSYKELTEQLSSGGGREIEVRLKYKLNKEDVAQRKIAALMR